MQSDLMHQVLQSSAEGCHEGTPVTTPYERQLALEEEMQGLGIQRYRAKVQKLREGERESASQYGRALFADSLDRVKEAIELRVAASGKGTGMRRSAALMALTGLDPYVCAFCSLRVILDTLSGTEVPPRAYAIAIGGLIEEQVRLSFYHGEKKPLFKEIIREMKEVRKKSVGRQKTALFSGFKSAGVHWEFWGDAKRYQLGMVLFEIVMEVTGYITVESSTVRRKTTLAVQPTPAVMEWVQQMTERNELLSPEFLPMVVRPRAWESVYGGGYMSPYVKKVSLVKTRRKPYLNELEVKIADGQLDMVLSAVNALQATPWRINPQVHAVASTLWDRRTDVKVMPCKDDIAPPPRPDDIRTDQDVRREYARKAAPIREENRVNRSKRFCCSKMLWVAGKFQDEPEMYFVHQLDFRGRAYPVNAYLHPQGEDLAKGLLIFATGKPIEDSTAAEWLMIHGANQWGFDKVGLAERIEWVNENLEMVVSCALQPLEDHRWMDADKPWQFLAFCFEYNGFIEHGYGYMSSLAVALDGSCNGIQHFSAMLLDPVGGKAVNLIPSDTPQDIYQEVADVVKKRLAATDHDFAVRWLNFGVTRKTTKRPVMVLPYGGTKHSCLAFVKDWYKEQRTSGAPSAFSFEEEGRACYYLGEHVWESIGEVVKSAQVAMRWLQETARAVSKYGLAINWTAPSGFPVRQEYHREKQQEVSVFISGKHHATLLNYETDELDKVRQKNGIAPNFVHSLDAAAMTLTVNRMIGAQCKHFHMVHDSYGVHAADTQLLGEVLRNTFVRMYSDRDVMAEFSKEVGSYVEGGMPEAPKKGTLNLKDIESSDFFFA